MRDASGRHICPEPGLWLLGMIAVFVLIPLAFAFVMYGAVALLWLLRLDPGFFPLAMLIAIVVGYFLLCIPGLVEARRSRA